MSTAIPSTPVRPGHEQAPQVVLPWLVRLRWASVIALAGTAWAANAFWRVKVPLGPLVIMFAAMAASNAALTFQLRSPAPRRAIIGAVLVIDVGLLTAILYLVGGPLNPFSIVYLVGTTVAAVSLGHRWAIALGVLSNVAYAFTFFYNRPFEFLDPAFSSRVLTLHLSGMWVALSAATGLIAYFVGRVSEALTQRERELTDARAATARSERLAALFSLGAGAAHELATPLSTIATAAGELERTVAGLGHTIAPAASEYLRVIRGEVDRCKTVLDQLSGRTAAASATDAPVALSRLVDDLRYRLGESLAGRLDVTLPPSPQAVEAPAEPLRQALIALLRNAFDASSPSQRVTMNIEQSHGLRVEVIDHGRGMNESEMARAGEPFFTTKPTGAGLGLGLFLVRAFVDQMGGTLRLRSKPGEGTAVVLDLPGSA